MREEEVRIHALLVPESSEVQDVSDHLRLVGEDSKLLRDLIAIPSVAEVSRSGTLGGSADDGNAEDIIRRLLHCGDSSEATAKRGSSVFNGHLAWMLEESSHTGAAGGSNPWPVEDLMIRAIVPHGQPIGGSERCEDQQRVTQWGHGEEKGHGGPSVPDGPIVIDLSDRVEAPDTIDLRDRLGSPPPPRDGSLLTPERTGARTDPGPADRFGAPSLWLPRDTAVARALDRIAPAPVSVAPALEAAASPQAAVRANLWLLVGIVIVLTVIGALVADPARSWLNWYLAVVWSLYVPVGLVGVAGVLLHHRGGRIPLSQFTGVTEKQVIFNVPSMCSPGAANALRRVLTSIVRHAPANLENWRIDVVIEEGNPSPELLAELGVTPNVRVIIVPADYETLNGAAFKTRANHYAMEVRRRVGENSADTYIYHLDDDTHVGPDTVASLVEFVHKYHGDRYLAQGILAFPRELTSSRLAWYCDAIRPADDVSRFAFFTGWLGRPLGGLHGEHVIIRSDIEDEIGWDFRDTVIEDAYFALEFSIPPRSVDHPELLLLRGVPFVDP